MSSDSLGDRMKRSEAVPETYLMRRMPVILRLDGKAFSNLTRNMDKPIDWKFAECMGTTAAALCEQVGGAMVAYVQSDEISLLLTDYRTLHTQPWFNYRVQKVCSIAASIATATFNIAFSLNFPESDRIGLFDCRAFNLPRADVNNYFLWRQQDATRNSISSLAQAHFSHKQLHRKNTYAMQDMLMLEKNVNWNDCPIIQKRGFCAVKKVGDDRRTYWDVDSKIPIFSADVNYIQKYVDIEED